MFDSIVFGSIQKIAWHINQCRWCRRQVMMIAIIHMAAIWTEICWEFYWISSCQTAHHLITEKKTVYLFFVLFSTNDNGDYFRFILNILEKMVAISVSRLVACPIFFLYFMYSKFERAAQSHNWKQIIQRRKILVCSSFYEPLHILLVCVEWWAQLEFFFFGYCVCFSFFVFTILWALWLAQQRHPQYYTNRIWKTLACMRSLKKKILKIYTYTMFAAIEVHMWMLFLYIQNRWQLFVSVVNWRTIAFSKIYFRRFTMKL